MDSKTFGRPVHRESMLVLPTCISLHLTSVQYNINLPMFYNTKSWKIMSSYKITIKGELWIINCEPKIRVNIREASLVTVKKNFKTQ